MTAIHIKNDNNFWLWIIIISLFIIAVALSSCSKEIPTQVYYKKLFTTEYIEYNKLILEKQRAKYKYTRLQNRNHVSKRKLLYDNGKYYISLHSGDIYRDKDKIDLR